MSNEYFRGTFWFLLYQKLPAQGTKDTEKSHKWTFLFMLNEVRQENMSAVEFDSKALKKNLFIYLFTYYTLFK